MALVMKFGGTSVADAARIEDCARIVRDVAARTPVVVVVSAMDGVTEELLALADASVHGGAGVASEHVRALSARHAAAAAVLGAEAETARLLEELERLAGGLEAVGEVTPRSLDLALSFGERLSAVLVSAALTRAGVPARALTGQQAGIVTDAQHGEAEPLIELSFYQLKETLGPLLARGEVPVITGFIAATQHGTVTTLGRGGSDYTATLIGSALPAEEIWIWSDVEGLMDADPRIVPGARRIERIAFPEAVEMAQFGAKAMHPRALEPAAERGIPVRIKNTFDPAGAGTLIVPASADRGASVVRSVHVVSDAALVTVTGAAMIGRSGSAARVFQALADHGVNIRMISQSVSEAGISMAVAGRHLQRARAALEAALLRTHAVRAVEVEPDVALVAMVGSGMRGTPGVAARLFAAIARRGINVIAIAQGSSELSVTLVVPRDAGPHAVRALHDEFLGAAR